MKIRKAKSITHEHLLSILNTESESRITGGGLSGFWMSAVVMVILWNI